jgi:hypothetical protein
MNWHNIKKDYPVAFKEFQGITEYYWDVKYVNDIGILCIHRNGKIDYQEDNCFSERDLYNFFDEHGIYVQIIPEYYPDGINWNWKLMWYAPKEEWLEDKIYVFERPIHGPNTDPEINKLFDDLPSEYRLSFYERAIHGTSMYGDNNEYPTRLLAEKSAFSEAFKILNDKLIKI